MCGARALCLSLSIIAIATSLSASFYLFRRVTARQVCYEGLGCFPEGKPWTSLTRPLPSPQSPDVIQVFPFLYTRNNRETPERIITWPSIEMGNSEYNGQKKNFLFIHGWLVSANVSTYLELKDAVLKRFDCNVFLVDWSSVSKEAYTQAVSDIRVVAALMSRFIRYLIATKGASVSKFHLVGISLGAQIASYIAKNITGIAKLTALDPAGPLFEGTSPEVRVDAQDANFMEVAHTNGKPLGYGMWSPVGLVDFYFNGGERQPGCTAEVAENVFEYIIHGEGSIKADILNYVLCSHLRAVTYYIEAIANESCVFWGKKQNHQSEVINNSQADNLDNCTLQTCSPFGMHTEKYPARGRFDVITRTTQPFCAQVCYEGLGCFPEGKPWTSQTRRLPSPQSPDVIPVFPFLYTRNNRETPERIIIWPSIEMDNSEYNGEKKNFFFVHGFGGNANVSIFLDLKDAVLKRLDCNVFLVDWSSAFGESYTQTCSDIRVIAALVSRFIRYLIATKGASVSKVHLVGLSVGAQIASYIGKNISEIAKLTALDPSGPLFEGTSPEVRVDAHDANFVEVVHTNGKPLGFGMWSPVGSVDFYFNGGERQPGCTEEVTEDVFEHIIYGKGSVIVDIPEHIFCSHVRALTYYIEAIENENCIFWGKKQNHQSGVISLDNCTLQTCSAFGLYTEKFPARGRFDVITRTTEPFCEKHENVKKSMERQLNSTI